MPIRPGFDRDPRIRPSARQFARDAAPWKPIPDDGWPTPRIATPRLIAGHTSAASFEVVGG
jgi:hypothetical protein